MPAFFPVPFDPSSAGAGLLMLAQVFACTPAAPPTVNLVVNQAEPVIDHAKSAADLARFQIDTVSPYDHKGEMIVGGLMSGEIQIGTDIQFAMRTSPFLRRSCMWITHIDIHVRNTPTIHVAREYARGGCRYQSTLEHERRHANTDRKIVDKYLPVFRQIAQEYASTVQTVGPFDTPESHHIKQGLSEGLSKAITDIMEPFNVERRTLQQAIDSREEYDRLSRKCESEDRDLIRRGVIGRGNGTVNVR